MIEQGYAALSQESATRYVTFPARLCESLRHGRVQRRDLEAGGDDGEGHVAAQAGRLIECTVVQKFELTHGPHAMIETQRAFYLVT